MKNPFTTKMEILKFWKDCFVKPQKKMDIWNEIISIVVSNGVFAILFVGLFVYQLKDSSKRELKYQKTIEELTKHLSTLEEVKRDICDIKDFLRSVENEEIF